jgi:hydroxysqualene dehydroxylase
MGRGTLRCTWRPRAVTRHVHVVGAGIAGLAAAVRLSEEPDLRITIWEATQRAGGRCWSFHDAKLDRGIDNGNHLVLSGNEAVLDYARRIGSESLLSIASDATLPFFDAQDESRWEFRIPSGLSDLLRLGTGLPGSALAAGLDIRRLLRAGRDATVADALPGRGSLWHRLWVPLTFAVLNEPPERGSARLFAEVLRGTILRGGAACRPVLFPKGLGAALVDPAVELLKHRGVALRWRSRLSAIRREHRRACRLGFHGGVNVDLGERDGIILAAAGACAATFPTHPQPRPGLSILNGHFRVPPSMAERIPPILGVTSGSAQWIFRRGDVLSVTVSGLEATPLARLDSAEASKHLWQDVAAAAGCPAARPHATRLVRERHATWDQSPEGIRLRPEPKPDFANLVLAGDYVSGQLPATLESAVSSGFAAATDFSVTVE